MSKKEILFLNKNSINFKLKSKVIDLAIVDPPSILSDPDVYGGDVTEQLFYKGNYKKYIKDVTKVIKNIENSLLDEGNIFLILDDVFLSGSVIDSIMKKTGLSYVMSFTIGRKKTLQEFSDFSSKTRIVYRFIKGNGVLAYSNKYLLEILLKRKSLDFDSENVNNDFSLYRYGYVLESLPIDLVDMLVTVFCPEKGLVYDPFCGTGIVGLASLKNNRRFLGLDVSSKMIRLSEERIRLECGYPEIS
jgi:DNA modification methylase